LFWFPAKKEVAAAWKILLGLEDDFDHNNRFVCSNHFAVGDFHKGN
jgi:hypothetical protein